MLNKLPGDPSLPPGVSQKDIDRPFMRTCELCEKETEILGKRYGQWLCDECLVFVENGPQD